MTQTDPRLQKWRNWLNTIVSDVQYLLLSRYIFSTTINIVSKNEMVDKSSMYFDFYLNTYIDSTVMGIRRQVKIHKDSISFARLLEEISSSPQIITRSDFREHYNDDRSYLRELNIQQDFDQFANPEAPFIAAERVENDLTILKQTCIDLENYADNRIAHWEKGEYVLNFSSDDVDKALDTVEKLVKRYYLLLFGVDYMITPIPARSIFHIFEVAWIKSPNPEINNSDE